MDDTIRLQGVRQNNLQNFDLAIPVKKLTVITGVSGSGKSSLAFDTLFAEGQRRYIETFSPYARQFFDRMEKPKVDRIDGIPPAIAIEQKNSVKSTRSTVGTMTEICDYMKDLWRHFSRPYCRDCDQPIQSDTPDSIWQEVSEMAANRGFVYVVFDVPLSASLGIRECLQSVVAQGFQRCLLDGKVVAFSALLDRSDADMERQDWRSISVIQDRLRPAARSRSRFIEACEQAFRFGRDRLRLCRDSAGDLLEEVGPFSRLAECRRCGESVPTATRSLFSFNSPVGACEQCRGFGRVIGVDYGLAIPDSSLSLAEGAVKPWQKGHGMRSQRDMMKSAKREGVPTRVPFRDLSGEEQKWVIEGSPGYGSDAAHRWPRAWYGVKGYFDWLESKAYKMHYRVLLARYRAYHPCPVCRGTRFKSDVLRYRVELPSGSAEVGKARGKRLTLDLPGFYALTVGEALQHVEDWRSQWSKKRSDPLSYALDEVVSRLEFMSEVGLSYLTLDRPTKTLSGGETERINLTSCLGTRLVNTLFVLDEPSVGLHAVNIDQLIAILKRLRDAGNTVVVVEHDEAIMRAADFVVDIGPESGSRGGELVFAGSTKQLLRCARSTTAQFLRGAQIVDDQEDVLPVDETVSWLEVSRATCHNLSQLSVRVPLNRLVCVTGVSGSGKTTLVKEVLVPSLERLLGAKSEPETSRDDEASVDEGIVDPPLLSGYEGLDGVVMIDQSPLGRTPRSNPVVYIGVFEELRKLFESSEEAHEEGLTAGAFSFNSARGQCERCRGAGFEKIEMQFLSDVFIRCSDCDGTRYRREIRDFQVDFRQFYGQNPAELKESRPVTMSIVDFLQATVDDTVAFLEPCQSKRASRAVAGLKWLQAVGLGYLEMGQPVNTLSGGESQRLKVVRHLNQSRQARTSDKTLFVFDEPTTGLHFADVKVLIQMFRNMVADGHSLIVVEHHLDLIRAADWVIDLGPGAGTSGGRVVFEGPPGGIGQAKRSFTGQALGTGNTKKAT